MNEKWKLICNQCKWFFITAFFIVSHLIPYIAWYCRSEFTIIGLKKVLFDRTCNVVHCFVFFFPFFEIMWLTCNLIFIFLLLSLLLFHIQFVNCIMSSISDIYKTMENNIQRNGEPEPAKGPPPVPITKSTPSANNLGSNSVKKDKRMNSSRFNISKNRELTPLPRLAGKCVLNEYRQTIWKNQFIYISKWFWHIYLMFVSTGHHVYLWLTWCIFRFSSSL